MLLGVVFGAVITTIIMNHERKQPQPDDINQYVGSVIVSKDVMWEGGCLNFVIRKTKGGLQSVKLGREYVNAFNPGDTIK